MAVACHTAETESNTSTRDSMSRLRSTAAYMSLQLHTAGSLGRWIAMPEQRTEYRASYFVRTADVSTAQKVNYYMSGSGLPSQETRPHRRHHVRDHDLDDDDGVMRKEKSTLR